MRQVVILAVGSVWRAEYELYAHAAVAANAGLAGDIIQALASRHRRIEGSDWRALAHLSQPAACLG